MKRYISLSLAAVVLFVSLVLPVSATGLDSSTDGFGIDALPYLDNSYLSTSDKPADTSFPVTLSFDQDVQYSYISFVVSTDDSSCQFYSGSTQLDKVHLGGSMYSFYGITGSIVADSFTLNYIKGSASSSYIRFISFKIHPRDYFYPNQTISISSSGTTYYTVSDSNLVSQNVYYQVSNSATVSRATFFELPKITADFRSDTGATLDTSRVVFLTTYLLIPWKGYDSYQIQFYSYYDTVTDFTVTCNGIDVLANIQGVDIPNSSDGSGYYTLTLDFSQLDPNINSDNVSIMLRGYCTLNSSNPTKLIYVNSLVGFIDVVSTNFWPSWLNKIISQFDLLGQSINTGISTWSQNIISSISSWGQAIVDAIVGDQTQNESINNALDTQESVNEQINVQLGSAVDDWDGNVSVVSGGFNTAFQNASPSLNWLSNLAQSVFSGMGWFGNMFFFLGFLHVFFLLMSKSGLGRSIANAARRSDSK